MWRRTWTSTRSICIWCIYRNYDSICVQAVRLETSKDIDSNISIGTIRFEDARGREIVMNVKIEQDADIPTI